MRTHFTIQDALRSKRTFGSPLVGQRRTDLPLTASVGLLSFILRGFVYDSVPPAEEEVERYIEALLPRFERGEVVTGAEQIQRRLARVGDVRTWVQYRRALESFAIPVEWLPRSPMRDAAAACTDSLWPWGAEGVQLDRDHEAAEIEKARAAADAAERERIARLPDPRTYAERGLVRILWPRGATPESMPAFISGSSEFGVSDAHRKGIETDAGTVLVYKALFGLHWPAGPVAGTSAVILPSDVTGPAPQKPRAMAVQPWMALRCKSPDEPISEFRDGRTADGEHAEAALRAWAAPLAERSNAKTTTASERVTLARVFVQAAVRGRSLAPKLAAYVYNEMFSPAVTQARLEILMGEAVSGAVSWFAKDECFTPPDPTFLEQFAEFFSPDKEWRKVLRALAKGKGELGSDEIEAAIIGAGLVEKFNNANWERVAKVFGDLGWEKSRTRHSRSWVRKVEVK